MLQHVNAPPRHAHHTHAIHTVHRDLKLENLLLARKDDISSMKIADFGLAKSLDRGQAQTVCGTPAYVRYGCQGVH